MSIFDRFNRFKDVLHLPTGDEKGVFIRTGRSNGSNFKNNFVHGVLVSQDTKMVNGMVFTCLFRGRMTTFIVVSVRRSAQSVQATVYECNCKAKVLRLIEKFDEYDNRIGKSLELVAVTPANYVTVNATMRVLEGGLLPSTTIEFRMPVCDIREMDRIELNGENYCVDVIDKTKFFGLYAVQVSYDERSL